MKQFLIAFLLLLPVHAYTDPIVEDFTSSIWGAAIGTNNTSATVGGLTLVSSGGNLTFNNGGSELNGCQSGLFSHGLACMGDGIGIGNDEITEGFNVLTGVGQMLTLLFDTPVNILDVHLLDLFGGESTGEIAWIVINGDFAGTSMSFGASAGNNGLGGGYWETGFTAGGVTSLTLYSTGDRFSDYALARVVYASVPEPGTFGLLTGMLLVIGALRKKTA